MRRLFWLAFWVISQGARSVVGTTGDAPGSASIQVRFLGARPPASVTAEVLGNADSSLWKGRVPVVSEMIRVSLPPPSRFVVVAAPGFLTKKVPVEQIRLGLVLEAPAHLRMELDSALPNARLLGKRLGTWQEPIDIPPSKADGEFELAPGLWDLLVDLPQSAPILISEMDLRPGERRFLRDVPVKAGSIESIAISGPGGQPIASATIAWKSKTRRSLDSLVEFWISKRLLTAKPDSLWRVDRVPPVGHFWEVNAPGFRPAILDGDVKADQKGEKSFRISLRRLPQLALRVTAEDRTFEGADVVIRPVPQLRSSEEVRRFAKAGPPAPIWSGHVAINAETLITIQKSGTYRAEAHSEGRSAIAELAVGVDEASPDLVPFEVRFAKRVISGTVRHGDQAFPGVSVQVFPADKVIGLGPGLARTKTDDDGTYSLEVWSTGRFHMNFATPGGATTSAVVDVDSYEVRQDVRFDPGVLTVAVADRRDGKPIPGARVVMQEIPRSGTVRTFNRETDDEGVALFEDIDEGKAAIRVSRMGFGPSVREIQLRSADNGQVAFELSPSSSYRGRVVAQSGHPVPNARLVRPADPVNFDPVRSTTNEVGVTDSAGEFVLDELFGFPTPVFAIASGYTVGTTVLPPRVETEDDSQTATSVIEVSPYFTGFPARVLSRAGTPRQDVVLLVLRSGTAIPLEVLNEAAVRNGVQLKDLIRTDAMGQVRVFDLLSPGLYVVKATRAGVPAPTSPALIQTVAQITVPLARPSDIIWSSD